MAPLEVNVLLVWCCLALVGPALCVDDEYCSTNNFNFSGSYMRFTKEANFEEFALVRRFKGLHCCAKGYRSIEWYKDDKLYPWALDVSNFIISPESANQTIYTQDVKKDDAGNYTCVLKNDTVIHSHTIRLRVFEKVPDEAKITYISRDSEVKVGEDLRLFCEAFAGQIDLPDAYSEAYWKRVAPNGTSYETPPHVEQTKTTREDNQTFGIYLLISKVRREDFGQYECIISKPGNTVSKLVNVSERFERCEPQGAHHQPAFPGGRLLLAVSAVFCGVLLSVVCYVRYGLGWRVLLKEALERRWRRAASAVAGAASDGKTRDVLVLHSPDDAELVVGVLVPTLSGLGYVVGTREFVKSVPMWYDLLRPEADRSRRLLLALSPATLGAPWTPAPVLELIGQLRTLDRRLVVVTLRPLPRPEAPETKDARGETLGSLARKVGVLEWTRRAGAEDKFWLALRLKMPPRGGDVVVATPPV